MSMGIVGRLMVRRLATGRGFMSWWNGRNGLEPSLESDILDRLGL